jgi:hypothetical protein
MPLYKAGNPACTGSIVYARFTVAAAGDYKVAENFSGDNIMMHMDNAGATETDHAMLGKPGIVLGARSAAAGDTISVQLNCAAPNNLPGLGFVESIELLS